jgi:hypothetical protein
LKLERPRRFTEPRRPLAKRVANKRKPTGTHLYKNSAFRFGMQLALLPKAATGHPTCR